MSVDKYSTFPPTNFESIFYNSHTPYILLHTDIPDYTVADVNKAFLKATKSTREALIGKPVFSVFTEHEDGAGSGEYQKIRSAFETVIKTQQPVDIPAHRYDVKPENGEFKEVYWISKIIPILNDRGIPTHILHSPIDVTTQYAALQRVKASNRALEEQRKQLHEVFMQAPVGIGIFLGADYVVDLVNPSICALYGKTSEELLGKPIFSVLTEAAGKGFEQLLDNVRLTGVPFIGTALEIFLVKNNEVISLFVDFVYEPFRDINGNIIGVIVVATDTTEQVKSKQRLEENEAQFRFMAESMPQQVWTANADGALEYVNQRTEEYFGRSAAGVVGAGWQEFIHPEDLPKCLETWVHSLQTGELYQIEFRLRRHDGQYRWHLGRALPLKGQNKIMNWLGTNTDIEDQKRNEQIKDEFISIASHELKTPLTSLKAYMQLLERSTAASGQPNRFVEKSVHQIKRLEKLVNDLLDVSKIAGGKLNYNMQVFDLATLITETVQSEQLSTPSHQFRIESNPPVQLEGDYYRLEQVIANFLSNAVKYSPDSNKVLIRSAIQGNEVVVAIQDFGIGIEKSHLDKLFDRFYRVDNTSSKFEGLGLGLYVASEILTRHKGNFWIESELGKGSVFYFKLPVFLSPES